MDRGNLSMGIQIRRLGRREEHESFVACEEAIDVIVEIVMLMQMVSRHPRERGIIRDHRPVRKKLLFSTCRPIGSPVEERDSQ